MEWEKVLLAEEIEFFLELEKTYFRNSGIALLLARDGHQAFSMAVAERPNLIIMNLDLPGIGGDECSRRIKDHPDIHSTPVFLVASSANPEVRERARRAGCEELLIKPIQRRPFHQSAGRHLGIIQRNNSRIKARLRVHYGTGDQKLLTHYSVNLSTGGIFMETNVVLPVDTPLSLEFSLPGSVQQLQCRGRVAWVNLPGDALSPSLPPGMGIQFVDLKLAELHAIKEFVQMEALQASW
jgi:uncharacterized protein (TIGR02266 family)